MRLAWLRLMAAMVVMAGAVSPPGSAAAFGTIEGGGQHRAHERITRAALACASAAGVDGNCFEPRSMDLLAGRDPSFGGVGAPDSDELSDPTAHCDNADFLVEASYPRTRDLATAGLMDCVNHLRLRFDEGIDGAADLVDAQGRVMSAEVRLDPRDCRLVEGLEDRAKCTSLEGLGRVLHGAQDFYAHSNWADEADPTRPVGADNPPGLDLPGPSAMLDLRTDGTPTVPVDLSTGCYALKDQVPGVGECAGRVTHAALNKDNGLVDPTTGDVAEPTRPRGMVKENFAKAVAGAIAETQRQWRDFQSELSARYGQENGALMVCGLTHDDPVNDCPDRQWIGVIVGLLLAGCAALIAVVLLIVLGRRRRRG
ncbi:MAG TPA: hypothetical protein VIT42_07505 [Microlunatus sp.]